MCACAVLCASHHAVEHHLDVESPGTEHAGQYSCVTGMEEVLLSKDLL